MININKIAVSNLKSAKLRSILTIITIALTTCLLASVGIITLNMIDHFKASAIKTAGNSHGFYRRLDESKVNKVKNHREIESVGINSSELGKNTIGKTDFSMFYIDDKGCEMANQEVENGKLPQLQNEIALDKEFIEEVGSKAKVGNKVILEFNDTKGNLVEKEFVISGIIERTEGNVVNNRSLGIVSKSFIEDNDYYTVYKASIRVKGEERLSGNEIEGKVNQIAKDLKLSKNPEDIKMNDLYLMSKKPDPTIIMGAVAITLIIILSALIVIYNIFYISVISKTQELGKLKAIGATKKQIKRIILKEGLILSTVAIPIGIILGYVISGIILKTLMHNIEIEVKSALIVIIFATIFTIITVYLALLKPMKIASKISPVEAMKYNGSFNSKKKTRKGYLEVDIKKLTYSNLFRNKKRTYLTLLSLSLSGILIITISSILQSVNTELMVKQQMVNDFEFKIKYATYDYENERAGVVSNNPLNENFIKNIENMKGVETINIVTKVDGKLNKSGDVELAEFIQADYENQNFVDQELSGYDDDMLNRLKEHVKYGEIDIEKIKSGEEIIIATGPQYWYGLEVGDTVNLTYNNGEKDVTKDFKIGAIVSSYIGGHMFTSNDFIKSNDSKNYTELIQIEVKDKYYDSINNVLKGIADEYNNLDYKDYKGDVEANNKAFFGVNSMGYGLVGVIGMISLVNLVNTMVTSIISRKKELGMLQAIGMSDKQLKKMLQIEGMFYTGITIVSSLVIGSTVGYFAYLAFYNSGAEYAVYKFPFIPAILLVIVSIFVQIGITYFINNYFNKESLVDRVRYSE